MVVVMVLFGVVLLLSFFVATTVFPFHFLLPW